MAGDMGRRRQFATDMLAQVYERAEALRTTRVLQRRNGGMPTLSEMNKAKIASIRDTLDLIEAADEVAVVEDLGRALYSQAAE